MPLGLPLGPEAPVMTPDGVILLFPFPFSFFRPHAAVQHAAVLST